MTTIVNWLRYQYSAIVQDAIHDEEVDSWFLMGSIWPMMSLMSFYLLFVLKIGPQYMENRKPFRMKNVLLFYNFTLSLFNALIFKMFTNASSWKHVCELVSSNKIYQDTQNFSTTLALLILLKGEILNTVAWYYMFSKVIELLDTVFFVLRKKQSQVSVLHVYHHASMTIFTWLYLKYGKFDEAFLTGLVNTFIHVVMYMYYFLAALGPSIQKYLWWKKYLTVLQLAQFSILLLYLCAAFTFGCKVHRAFSIFMFINTSFFMLLFLNFYRKSYSGSTKRLASLQDMAHNTAKKYN